MIGVAAAVMHSLFEARMFLPLEVELVLEQFCTEDLPDAMHLATKSQALDC